MREPGCMHRRKTTRSLNEQPHDFAPVMPPLGVLVERAAANDVHDDERDTVCTHEVVQRNHVRMHRAGEREGLAVTRVDALGIGRELDRNGTLEFRIVRSNHDPMRAGAEQIGDLVASELNGWVDTEWIDVEGSVQDSSVAV
jgi:hypothetical protein